MIGYFNFNKIEWTTVSTPNGHARKEFKCIETLRYNFLTQQVIQPNRKRGTDNHSTLDLVLNSDENLLQTEAPFGKSDHSMIKIKLQTASLHPTDTKEHYMYGKGYYGRLREEIDIDGENVGT